MAGDSTASAGTPAAKHSNSSSSGRVDSKPVHMMYCKLLAALHL
jgi:hypothetical protein